MAPAIYGKPNQPASTHPSFPSFYFGKDVITRPHQLHPGLKVTQYNDTRDPANGGIMLKISSKPYKIPGGEAFCVDAYPEGLDSGSNIRIYLGDHGIMSDDSRPYNQNRLVVGWVAQ